MKHVGSAIQLRPLSAFSELFLAPIASAPVSGHRLPLKLTIKGQRSGYHDRPDAVRGTVTQDAILVLVHDEGLALDSTSDFHRQM